MRCIVKNGRERFERLSLNRENEDTWCSLCFKHYHRGFMFYFNVSYRTVMRGTFNYYVIHCLCGDTMQRFCITLDCSASLLSFDDNHVKK